MLTEKGGRFSKEQRTKPPGYPRKAEYLNKVVEMESEMIDDRSVRLRGPAHDEDSEKQSFIDDDSVNSQGNHNMHLVPVDEFPTGEPPTYQQRPLSSKSSSLR